MIITTLTNVNIITTNFVLTDFIYMTFLLPYKVFFDDNTYMILSFIIFVYDMTGILFSFAKDVAYFDYMKLSKLTDKNACTKRYIQYIFQIFEN